MRVKKSFIVAGWRRKPDATALLNQKDLPVKGFRLKRGPKKRERFSFFKCPTAHASFKFAAFFLAVMHCAALVIARAPTCKLNLGIYFFY